VTQVSPRRSGCAANVENTPSVAVAYPVNYQPHFYHHARARLNARRPLELGRRAAFACFMPSAPLIRPGPGAGHSIGESLASEVYV
jgi:hypothetical protein